MTEDGHQQKLRIIQHFVDKSSEMIANAIDDRERAIIADVITLNIKINAEHEEQFPNFHKVSCWRDDAIVNIKNREVYVAYKKSPNRR